LRKSRKRLARFKVSRLFLPNEGTAGSLAGQKVKRKKTTQAAKSSSHQLRKRGHLGRKAPSPEKKRLGQVTRVIGVTRKGLHLGSIRI